MPEGDFRRDFVTRFFKVMQMVYVLGVAQWQGRQKLRALIERRPQLLVSLKKRIPGDPERCAGALDVLLNGEHWYSAEELRVYYLTKYPGNSLTAAFFTPPFCTLPLVLKRARSGSKCVLNRTVGQT